MCFDLLLYGHDLIMHFENALLNQEHNNPLMYQKAYVDIIEYKNVIRHKGKYCYITTFGGPENTTWYIYHTYDDKIVYINKIMDYYTFQCKFIWFNKEPNINKIKDPLIKKEIHNIPDENGNLSLIHPDLLESIDNYIIQENIVF